MVSKRPKKQFERSNILELGYQAVSGGEGRWVCPEHYGRALRCNAAKLASYRPVGHRRHEHIVFALYNITYVILKRPVFYVYMRNCTRSLDVVA